METMENLNIEAELFKVLENLKSSQKCLNLDDKTFLLQFKDNDGNVGLEMNRLMGALKSLINRVEKIKNRQVEERQRSFR